MATKNKPGAFDCYAKAEPDEPMFILLARDPIAPSVIEFWIQCRKGIEHKKPTSDDKLAEAHNTALDMIAWHNLNR